MLAERLKSSATEKQTALQEQEEKIRKEYEGKQTASSAETMNYTFRWPYGGSELGVAGEFNNWTFAPMTKEGDEFHVTVEGLKPETKYLYKYVIDGQWKEDLTAPTDDSQKVNDRNVINNVLKTGSASKDVRITALEKERDSLFRKVKTFESKSSDNKALTEQLNALKSQLEKAQEEKNNRVSGLEKELSDAKNRAENAEKQKADLEKKQNESSKKTQEEAEKAKKELSEAKSQAEQSSKKAAQLEQQLAEANKQGQSAKDSQAAVSELQKKLDDAQKQKSELQNQLETAKTQQAQSEKLASEKKSLQEELDRQRQSVSNFETQKNALEKQLQEERSKQASGNDKTNELEQKVSSLQKELQKAQSESADMQSQLSRAAEDVHKAKEALVQSRDAAAARENSISYTFRYPYGGENVAVGGEFNNWQEATMTKDEHGEHSYTVHDLKPETRYLYKYVIDGKWQEDLTAPTDNSQKVGDKHVTNNVLATGSSSKDSRIAALEKERDALFRAGNKHEQAIRKAHHAQSEAEKQLHNVQALLKQQQNEVIKQEAVIKPLRHQVAELEASSKSLKQQVQQLNTQISTAETTTRQLLQQSNTHETNHKDSVASIQAMHVYNNKLVNVLIRVVKLLRRVAPAREEKEKLADEVDSLLKQIQMDKLYKQQQETLEDIERGTGLFEEEEIVQNQIHPGKWVIGLTVPAVVAAGYVFLHRRW